MISKFREWGDFVGAVKRKISKTLLTMSVVILLIVLCYILLVNWSNRMISEKPYKNDKEATAYFIEKHYLLDDLSAGELLNQYSSPEAMVQSLNDPYSTILKPAEFKHAVEDLSGDYVGVGFEASKVKGEYLQILNVANGSPAMIAGLQVGDQITKIDEKNTMDMSREETLSLIKGEVGKKISFDVTRNNKNYKVDLILNKIESSVVNYAMLSDSIGYLSLKQFPMMIYKEISQAIKRMQEKHMESLILDLRGNQGGEIEEVAMIASLLLGEDITEFFKVNHKTNEPTIYNRTKDSLFCGPIYILVNEDTASAAELLTQVLQNANGATVIGEKTFGKGISQSFFYFDSGNILKLTTGEFFVPNMESFHGKGIMPDYVIEMDNRLVSSSFLNRSKSEWNLYLKGIKSIFIEQYGKESADKQLAQGDIQLKEAMNMAQ